MGDNPETHLVPDLNPLDPFEIDGLGGFLFFVQDPFFDGVADRLGVAGVSVVEFDPGLLELPGRGSIISRTGPARG